MTMRIIFIFAIFIIAPVFVAAQNKPSSSKKRQDTQYANPPAPISVNCNCTTKADDSKDKPQGWHKLVTWPEGIATWALILTLVAVGLQAIKSSQATTAMQESVEITVAQNRPWLLPQLQDGKDRIQEPHLKPVGSVPELRFSHCVFFFKNYGKIPAKALVLKAEMRIGVSPTKPPDSDVYDVSKVNFSPFIFPQDECVPHEAKLAPNGFITVDELHDINTGTRFLWLQGIVTYRHPVETESLLKTPDFETKFCYLWETRTNSPKPDWRLAGPKGTNEAS